VKDVFQANMDGLMQAFRDGGYSDLSLQVSVGNGNGGQNASQGQSQGAPARDYGRQVSSSAPAEVRADRYGSWTDRQINLTA
jgi:flagellar hook-length control protein FliK